MMHRPATSLLLAALTCALAGAACDDEALPPEPVARVYLPATLDDPAHRRIADQALAYLERMLPLPASLEVVSDRDSALTDAASRRPLLALFIGFEPESLPAEPMPGGEPFDDRFRLEVRALGAHSNPLDGLPGIIAVSLDGHHRLSLQYALYEALRRLGARFFHPEDEHVPAVPPAQVRARLERPTAIGQGPIFTPDYLHRSFSFHAPHPLEHLEAFSDPDHPIDEAERVQDWLVKQRSDMYRGAGRAIVPDEARAVRAAELDALRVRLGLRTRTGITLHNQQQGASADLDFASEEPLHLQIQRVVAARLEASPDAYSFGIHFGPTELTTTPDIPTVEAIDMAGLAALAIRPDLQIEINNHTSGTQPVEHFDDLGCPPGTNDRGVADYYDLSFHTDPRLGVRVHTVMFYPLEGPAPVYNQRTFAHKLCLMERASEEGRPLLWFPEGSYWLSFDNSVPVYLPLYIHTRHRDVELLRPLLAARGAGTLHSHRMFNSGHEWGYWQQDYAVGLLHWNAELPMRAILEELGDPLCPAAAWPESCPAREAFIDTLSTVMDRQAELFLEAPDFRGRPGGLYWYFAGEDPADELGAVAGLEFRPVRIAFREILRLSSAELEAFVAVDLAGLDAAAEDYDRWTRALTDHLDAVPEEGRRWLDEVIDGLSNNALRAKHAAALYRAVIASRAAEPEEATRALNLARQLSAEAEAVIRRREAAYRYPPTQTIAGPGIPNGTTYPFRVHHRTHTLEYWLNREAQVEGLLAGGSPEPDRLLLRPAFAASGTPVTITWPALSGLSGTISVGPELEASVGQESLTLPEGEAILDITGALETEGSLLSVRGHIVRSDATRSTPSGGFTLLEPDAAVARTVLAAIVPTMAFTEVSGRLAFAVTPSGLGAVEISDITTAPLAFDDAEPPAFISSPTRFALPIPDPGSGEVAATIRVREAVFSGEDLRTTGGGIHLDGELSTDDLVSALVELAGFEPVGARQTLADVLEVETLTPWLPFRAALDLLP